MNSKKFYSVQILHCTSDLMRTDLRTCFYEKSKVPFLSTLMSKIFGTYGPTTHAKIRDMRREREREKLLFILGEEMGLGVLKQNYHCITKGVIAV